METIIIIALVIATTIGGIVTTVIFHKIREIWSDVMRFWTNFDSLKADVVALRHKIGEDVYTVRLIGKERSIPKINPNSIPHTGYRVFTRLIVIERRFIIGILIFILAVFIGYGLGRLLM